MTRPTSLNEGNDFEDSDFNFPYDAEGERAEAIARRRAKAVLDALLQMPDFDLDDPDGSELIHQTYLRGLDSVIKENLDGSSIWQFVFLAGDLRESAVAKLRAWKKLEKDPKQAEKALVRECWELWRNDPTRYKGKADFARDMLNKFEHIKSNRVIERWCLQWESEPSK